MQSWEEFLSEIRRCGFEIISIREFRDVDFEVDGQSGIPHNLVAANRAKKLILRATSIFTGEIEDLESGSVYGAVDTSGVSLDVCKKALSGCSGPMYGGNPCEFSFNVMIMGVTSKIEQIGEYLQFVDWHNPNPFLWFLDSVETELEPDLWEKRRDEVLASAPEWVRSFIL